MLVAPLLAAVLAQTQPPATWYGPGTVSFNLQFAGNPYDPDVNDVHVRFVNEKGFSVDRLAYFDNGLWKAVLVSPQPGKYRATLLHNGKTSPDEPVPTPLLLNTPLPHGFIHADKDHTNRFAYDDGTPFYPLGFDLGWQDDGVAAMADELKKMGQDGLTWTRIWADDWDGKNPWWPQNDPYSIPGQLWPPALDKWEDLSNDCQADGVNFQMVLFHHGGFSTKTDPEWQNNPWNAAKGGFLKNAADFFTDPEAMRRAKMWLRYAVARYGGNPNLLAWELFNEVQWTDAAAQGNWAVVDSWHKQMADYIRSIDPYKHLITTSSRIEEASLWDDADFYQPHEYADDLASTLLSLKLPNDKPLFIGEFGPGGSAGLGVGEKSFIRNVIWESILRNDAGTAMYWYWDRVDKQNYYPEFAAWAQVLSASALAAHPAAKAMEVQASVGQANGLREVGWALIRLQGAAGHSVRLRWPGMTDGTQDLAEVDLDTGALAKVSATIKSGAVSLPSQTDNDAVLCFTPTG